ncbi:MAG TPA: alpha/beta fold hydrolase [Gemmatimonadaceae bacterium]|nr:alpha/beta fold hydrolase [Gemmatimonadaceae bacterium]
MPDRTYRPAWWLPGPHLPTLWGKFFRHAPPVPTRRERWDTPNDGDFVDLERLDAPAAGRPRVILLHGLEGSPRSHYVRGLFAGAYERGWGMDLFVFRSCGDEPNRTRRFYHSGETTDLAHVLDRVLRESHDAGDADAPVFLAGVSLGGNVLLKFLGERGRDLPPRVAAAAAVSVPFDLERGSRHISRGFARVYERHFLRTLRRKAVAKMERFPDLADRARLAAARTLYDFDDVVTAPVHGFADAADYYTRSSSLRWLDRVALPTLLLSAEDDPFLPRDVLDQVRDVARHNPRLVTEFVPRGGHVGFVAGTVPWRPFYYAEWRVLDFFASHLRRGAAPSPVNTTAHHSPLPAVVTAGAGGGGTP